MHTAMSTTELSGTASTRANLCKSPGRQRDCTGLWTTENVGPVTGPPPAIARKGPASQQYEPR